jgi:hypothetical protein
VGRAQIHRGRLSSSERLLGVNTRVPTVILDLQWSLNAVL